MTLHLHTRGSLCRYWADIDTELRRVAYEKRVRVRLLISCWASTQPVMIPFLTSLASVYDPKNRLDIQVVRQSLCPHAMVVSVTGEGCCTEHIMMRNPMFPLQRLFVVPASPEQKKIPYARVNHNKYMVTDKVAYIGKAAPQCIDASYSPVHRTTKCFQGSQYFH